MRISSATLYDQSMRSLNQQQSDLLKVSQQIASGRRVVRPSDDPQAASRAVQVSQAQALTGEYTASRISARNALSQEESVLNSIGDAVASAKSLIVEAANGTLSDQDRASVASQLEGIYQTVLGQANATDGNGRYLFGGYQDGSSPFIERADGGIHYVGDDNARQQRIDASRLMPVADNGATVFQRLQGATSYKAEADTGNTGAVTFDGPDLVNANDADYGATFQIRFSVTASGDASYSINGGAQKAYQSGQAIEFGGLSLTLDGAPADGDGIDVDKAANMNTDLFKTFQKALSVLQQPATSDTEKATRHNTLNNVMAEFDNSLDNVLMVRASVGSRLNELEVVDHVADNRQLNYAQTKSDLVDLDYTSAISEYSLRRVGLQAAQQAFVNMKGMSLFDQM